MAAFCRHYADFCYNGRLCRHVLNLIYQTIERIIEKEGRFMWK